MSVILTNVTLIGSGDVHCTPSTVCLLAEKCACVQCLAAHKDSDSVLRRDQTSLVMSFSNGASLLVEVGSTFRDSALACTRRVLLAALKQQKQGGEEAAPAATVPPVFRFPPICGLICTGTSQLSIGGIDDVREVTMRGERISCIAPKLTLGALTRIYPYIMPNPKEKLSENQKQLWTSHLQPAKQMQAGATHELAAGFLAPYVPFEEQLEEHVRSARALLASVPTVPPPREQLAAARHAVADAARAAGDANAVATPLPGCVEMRTLVINDALMGFAVSLEDDGRLKQAPAQEGAEAGAAAAAESDSVDDIDERPRRALVYLPSGDVLNDSVCGPKERQKLVETLCKMRVELAIVACPSLPVSAGAAAEEQPADVFAHIAMLNEQLFRVGGGSARFVLCGVPHTMAHLPPAEFHAKVRPHTAADTTRTVFEMGTDGQILLNR